MKQNNRGISLIALIITIAVLIIVATITIQKGVQRTEQAQIAKHNTNISTTQEEVESYYYYQGGDLPVVNLTPYSIQAGSTLQAEIIKNGEQSDNFYILDMSKLGKVSGKDGTGLGDDVFIVSSTKHTVYYARGLTTNGWTYHGLANPGSAGYLAFAASPTLAGSPTPTLTSTPTLSPTPTPTPVPGSGYFDGIVNSPKIATGMTPVRWSGSAWVTLTPTEQLNANNEWYDYRNTGGTANKWANARLNDGSLLVWIPRYTYQIASGEHTSTAGTINIRFSNGTTDDTSGGYRVSPAFYWGIWNIIPGSAMSKQAGGTELTGMWVGKFETSPANQTQGTSGDYVKILPAKSAWRNITVGQMFTECRDMQTSYAGVFGISTSTSVVDPHMTKQAEWGAVAYLSKYALGATEVQVNTDAGYMTASSSIVTYKAQSTTGTEYGIYDMSGGSYEFVAAYISNSHLNISSFGNSLNAAAAQYKEMFPKAVTDNSLNNYNGASQAYGFALYETSSGQLGTLGWYGDKVSFSYDSNPFFLRGGCTGDGTSAGLFSFLGDTGSAFTIDSFRVSIAVP